MKAFYRLLFIIITTVSCSSQPTTNQQDHLLKDSVYKEYTQIIVPSLGVDSIHFMTKLLQAYATNDSLALLSSLKTIQNFKDVLVYINANKYAMNPANIQVTNYDEVYSFLYKQPFCDTAINITITHTQDSTWAHSYHLVSVYTDTPYIITKQQTIALSPSDYKLLIDALEHADFWGLKPDNGLDGYGCSNLFIDGYHKTYGSNPGKTHTISRCGAEGTAIGLVFHQIMKKTKTKVSCFRYF